MIQEYQLKASSISCVVPTLNSALTLDMTLLSLRSQKNVDINVIVVDSGSTDGTLDICKRWNVKTLYAEPGNMYRAINAGLREYDTEWLAYINSDDWLYPDSLDRLIAQGNSMNSDVVYGNCDFTDGCGRFTHSFAPAKPSQLPFINRTGSVGFAQQSAIFRNCLYKQLRGFNEDYRLAADTDFYFRALQSGALFSYLPGLSVACFRLHPNQLSDTQAEFMRAENINICTELLKKPGLPEWAAMMQWKLANIPHYLLRFLRQSLLAGKPKFDSPLVRYVQLRNSA